MEYQQRMTQRFLEINELNPELESTINAKLDFMRELQLSGDATIRANGGDVCTDESQWSQIQRDFVDKHGDDEEFEMVLFWACDTNGYMAYGLNPITGVIPVDLRINN